MMGIGDILVWKGEPPGGNPYRGRGSLGGEERSRALGRFLRGKSTEGYTFWFGPACGGARRLTEIPEVNPSTIEFYWDADGTPKRSK